MARRRDERSTASWGLAAAPGVLWLLLLFVIPLSIAKNAIRIVTLTLLAIHVDPGYLDGQLHHDGGIVFFGLSLLIMLPFMLLLRRLERRQTPPTARPLDAAPA